jgi:hypothetical protein
VSPQIRKGSERAEVATRTHASTNGASHREATTYTAAVLTRRERGEHHQDGEDATEHHAGHQVATRFIRSGRRRVSSQPMTVRIHATATTGAPTNIAEQGHGAERVWGAAEPDAEARRWVEGLLDRVARPTTIRMSTTNPSDVRAAQAGRRVCVVRGALL